MNALASASTLRPAAAARQSRTERRDGRLQAAAVAQWRPSPTSPSSPMTLSSVVVGSSLRPARSDNTSSSPPRAASSRRRERPRSAEAAAASAVDVTSPPPPPPTRYYATTDWRRGLPKRPGKGGGEEAEEEFSSSPPPSFSPPREKVGIALPLFSVDDEPKALELPRAVESPADDPTLANPLQRLNRMSTGWMGVSEALFECFFD